MALPNKTFWCNYNARNYNSTTLTLPKENGQLFDNDLVFPSAVAYNDDHITISGDKRIVFSFNNISDNIFNRTTSTATMTFIAKLAGTNNTWVVSNRDSSKIGWMVKAGTFTAMAYNDIEYNYTFQNNPKIFTWRCGNGEQQYICQTDNVTGTPLQNYLNWVGRETRQINFFGGEPSNENWTGDFYWMYISPETLTDAEIQQVIAYNEGTEPSIPEVDFSNIVSVAIGNRDIIRITDSNSNVLWEKVKPCCGSGIPDDEVWYKQNNTAVPIYPFRPYGQNNSWFRCEDNETTNYIISNTYDSSDGWWKIKWSCDFYQTVGSGWYTKTEITEVILPDSFNYDQAECWNSARGITKITYGSGTTKLDEGACPPNVTDIYFYGATPPDLNPSNDGRGNYFRLHNSSIPVTVHIPQGCSWSSIASQLPNYVTVVDDLYCEIPGNWLTFTSNDASARVKLSKAGNSALYYLLTETFQYSVDDGTTWSEYTPDTYITVNLGDSVCFRGNNSGPFRKEEDNSFASWVFETDGSFAVSGDVTSLMNNVGGDIALPPRAFMDMFSYSDITSAPNLPSTTISAYCYCQMFKMCIHLVSPPSLPATTLANYCYYFMFYGCESMTSSPSLSATNLATGCYANMFQNCESLTTPASLPATTLADSCYSSMFLGSAITTAPALPATILTTGCYSNMFRSCHSLTVGPVLPATTLVTNCYDRMFLLDENLANITTYATTWDTAKAYQWLDGVAATGTFHNLGMATIPTNDSSGIPTGWTEILGQCDTPVCSFVDGIYGSGCNNYNGTAVMTIVCATAGATIYYKIGSGNFETYSSPVTLTTGSQTITTYATIIQIPTMELTAIQYLPTKDNVCTTLISAMRQ